MNLDFSTNLSIVVLIKWSRLVTESQENAVCTLEVSSNTTWTVKSHKSLVIFKVPVGHLKLAMLKTLRDKPMKIILFYFFQERWIWVHQWCRPNNYVIFDLNQEPRLLQPSRWPCNSFWSFHLCQSKLWSWTFKWPGRSGWGSSQCRVEWRSPNWS